MLSRAAPLQSWLADSAFVFSKALFSDPNLSPASVSLRAIRCLTMGGVSARVTGPNATQPSITTHIACRNTSFEMEDLRMIKPAKSPTSITAIVKAMTIKGKRVALIGSLGGQIAIARQMPTTVLTPETSKKRGQLEGAKVIDKPVQRATQSNETQKGKSRLGSMHTGHQDTAEQNAVSDMRRVLVRIEAVEQLWASNMSNC